MEQLALPALIVASISALLSLGSLAVSYMTYRRDAPLLALRDSYSVGLNGPPTIRLEVTNVGKRHTTLIEVGYKVDFDYELELHQNKGGSDTTPPRGRVKAQNKIILSKHPVLLAPGEMKQFEMKLDKWPDPIVHADFPLRAYAEGSHGKTCWGYSKPFLRMMLDSGWQSPVGTPPGLITPYPEELRPIAVYPSWMLWKPRHLRDENGLIKLITG